MSKTEQKQEDFPSLVKECSSTCFECIYTKLGTGRHAILTPSMQQVGVIYEQFETIVYEDFTGFEQWDISIYQDPNPNNPRNPDYYIYTKRQNKGLNPCPFSLYDLFNSTPFFQNVPNEMRTFLQHLRYFSEKMRRIRYHVLSRKKRVKKDFRASLRKFTDKMWDLQRRRETRKFRRSDDIHDRIEGYRLIPVGEVRGIEEDRENAFMNPERTLLVENDDTNYYTDHYEKQLLAPMPLEYEITDRPATVFFNGRSRPTRLVVVRQDGHENYYSYTLIKTLLNILGVKEEDALMRPPNQDDFPLCILGKDGWAGFLSPRIEPEEVY